MSHLNSLASLHQLSTCAVSMCKLIRADPSSGRFGRRDSYIVLFCTILNNESVKAVLQKLAGLD